MKINHVSPSPRLVLQALDPKTREKMKGFTPLWVITAFITPKKEGFGWFWVPMEVGIYFDMPTSFNRCSALWTSDSQRVEDESNESKIHIPDAPNDGMFIYIWLGFMKNVGKYSIHAASGYVIWTKIKMDTLEVLAENSTRNIGLNLMSGFARFMSFVFWWF